MEVPASPAEVEAMTLLKERADDANRRLQVVGEVARAKHGAPQGQFGYDPVRRVWVFPDPPAPAPKP